MFKAVLLGQWHSLSDPELEHSLITRIDFNLFCRFDELSIPDYSTLCRYRNWLAQDNTLSIDLSLFIDFYGLTLFAAGGLNNGGINDGGGCFLYF